MCAPPLVRRSVAPTLRRSDVVTLGLQHRRVHGYSPRPLQSKCEANAAELKPKSAVLKPKTAELEAQDPGAEAYDRGAEAQEPGAKPQDPRA